MTQLSSFSKAAGRRPPWILSTPSPPFPSVSWPLHPSGTTLAPKRAALVPQHPSLAMLAQHRALHKPPGIPVHPPAAPSSSLHSTGHPALFHSGWGRPILVWAVHHSSCLAPASLSGSPPQPASPANSECVGSSGTRGASRTRRWSSRVLQMRPLDGSRF